MTRVALILLLVMVLTGCGVASTASPATETTATPGGQTPSNGGEEATTSPGGQTLPAGSVEAIVLQDLAQQVGVSAAVLQLVDETAEEWSDSSLGCPDAGQMYLQVITPGYRLTFSDGSTTYEVHTDESGTNAVLCSGGGPTPLP